jgi:signal transduction histidine kinase
MTLRRRLSLTLLAVIVVLALPMVYGTGRLAELRRIAVQFRASHAEAFQILGDLQASLTALDRHQRSYVAIADPVFRSGMNQALGSAHTAFQRLEGAGYGAEADPVGRLLDSLTVATQRIEKLVSSGRVGQATSYLERVAPKLAATWAAVDGLRGAVDRASARDVARAGEISHRAVQTALASGAAALALALLVGLWTTGRLTRPLGRLRDGLASVASGEFVTPAGLPYSRQDEIGDLARSFRSMTEQLAQLDRVKSEFVNAISHDLKAPLGMIGTCAELIEERAHGALDAEQRELLTTIREHVRLLGERVNKLLHLSRLEAGAFPIQPEAVPVAHLFQAIDRTFAADVERRGLALSVVTESSLPPLVTVDADCLYNEILGNLLSNAMKFTPRGGRIEVRAWGSPNGHGPDVSELHMTVADTGIGMPPEELPFVFHKYYQGAGRRRGDGTGLGLAIVQQAVAAHEGRVSVESTPGRGTTFHVTLPVGGPSGRRHSLPPVEAPSLI